MPQVGAFPHKLSRGAPARARKKPASTMRVNDVPRATLQKVREPPQPVADKFAASYDPAVVKV